MSENILLLKYSANKICTLFSEYITVEGREALMRCIRKGRNLSNHTRFSSYTNALFSYFAPFTAIWGDGGKPNGGQIFFAKKLLHFGRRRPRRVKHIIFAPPAGRLSKLSAQAFDRRQPPPT